MKSVIYSLILSLILVGCSHTSKVVDLKDAPESCRPKAEGLNARKVADDPVMEAIFEGDSEKLKKLISTSQINLQKKDALGFSYLHLAAGVGNPELIEVLIGAGIPVNSKLGKKQSTPSHSAVSWGKVDSLRALQKNGADLSITNGDGKTPATLAMELKNPEILEFFKSQNTNSK